MNISQLIRPLIPTSPRWLIAAAGVLATLVGLLPAQAPLQLDELARRGLPTDSDQTVAVALGDIDGDGDLDIVCGNFGSQDRLYRNDGGGVFSDVTATTMPIDIADTGDVAMGDVDGDGDLDLAIGNRLYVNDGSGGFTDVTATQLPNAVGGSLAFGDVDGDGDLDLAVQDRLYINDGSGTFSDDTAARMPTGFGSGKPVLGDVDGDGDLDICLGRPFTPFGYYFPPHALYVNDGAGFFSDATATQLPDGNYYLTADTALGDVDGDGDLDIVSGGACTLLGGGTCNGTRLLVNDGGGTFTMGAEISSVVRRKVRLGDVDGDGDLDVVAFRPWSGGGLGEVLLNDGSGGFTTDPMRLPPVLDAENPMPALGDLDGDGDLDMVLGVASWNGYSGLQNRTYWNLQRQLHAPSAPQLGQPYGLDAYLRYGPSSTVDLAAIYLSTAPASIALGALGTLGIDPAQAAPFPTLIIPQPAGVGSVGFTVPNQPALVGLAIYSQAMLVAYPNDLRLSNVVRDVIQ